jgi:hypothetical protein
VKGPKSFYEAITDYKSVIYNIVYISLNVNIKIETIINDELYFIHNQAKMILNHLNNTKCTQKSPAYSYYVLKNKIFNYFTSDFAEKELFDDIFCKGKKFNKLVQIIKNDKMKETEFTDYNSARMTLYEME